MVKETVMNKQYIGDPICKDQLNRKLTGVCAGIGRHFNLPVWGVRTAAVLFTLFAPLAGVFGYFLASVLMPTKRFY